MSQPTFSLLTAPLLVRDTHGLYLPATTEQILQAARQAIDCKMPLGSEFTSASQTQAYLCAKLAGFEREVFAVLFLTTRHRLIEYAELFYGTLATTAVYPREIVRRALSCNAAAVILAHNHPSGNTEPSQADLMLTRRISAALALVDVRVLDHIIVGGNNTLSFAEQALL
ncbi:DNA repair protein RadC [Dickeya dadantii]|uniref:RadC family protein n=1 Tax=Dickeya dadantii TaxID=204038 RepID=UPI0014958726|nr:DNA repair protein RadC [Dickeya dadantii]NPE60764.1 DNA repair protein RadC [Dickeya dadantii]NPE70493.1 DNA repair protein RadC [Dickeya dadantii]